VNSVPVAKKAKSGSAGFAFFATMILLVAEINFRLGFCRFIFDPLQKT